MPSDSCYPYDVIFKLKILGVVVESISSVGFPILVRTPQGTTQVLNFSLEPIGSKLKQPRLTSIENSSSPEPQQGRVITGGVIVHVKTAVVDTILQPQVINLDSEQQQPQLKSIEKGRVVTVTGGVIV